MYTPGGPRNIVLDGGPDPPTARGGGSTFDAAFAKLLWPPVYSSTSNVSVCDIYTEPPVCRAIAVLTGTFSLCSHSLAVAVLLSDL